MANILLQIAVPGPFPAGLTYLFAGKQNQSLVGRRVLVPLRKKEVVGVIVGFPEKADVDETRLKPIIALIDETPLISAKLRELIHFMRDYYHVSLGDAYYTALPSLLCAGKPLESKRVKAVAKKSLESHPLTLNQEQASVVDAIEDTFAVHLLEGVTGSGKTEVYLKCAERALAAGKSVLVLVPEIGLTPQIVERFEQRLGCSVLRYHSGLTEAQKRDCWVHVLKGEAPIVIGTRSAVFLPFANLGLIVADEEHDVSYKQQTGVPYSAKSLALMRAVAENCPVILGTATPSAESYHFAEQGVYRHHRLHQRALTTRKNKITVIDMRKFKATAGLSKPLLEQMEVHLQAGHQVLIFLNRRGYAPILMCDSCGKQEKCPSCEMSYTLHQSPAMLLCHHCGRMIKIPQKCSECDGLLVSLGQGTEQLEEYIAKRFPTYKMLRLDQDATRKKGELEAKLAQIKTGEAKIIIGTQMIAKGHDFPGITWVGVVDLDYGFFAPDFRGIERMGQLLIQVSGRAGRGEKAGEVMIQTHVPDHPLLQKLLTEGYAPFIEQLLRDRKQAHWPPFQYLALLRAEGKNQTELMGTLSFIKQQIQERFRLSVLGPVPAFLKKKNNYYRAVLVLEARKRGELHAALDAVEVFKIERPSLRCYLDVDPIEMG